MPELLRMPEVAANTEEATLSSWPVAEQQRFAARDVIVTIETAKAVVDVEAEKDGVIIHRLVDAGADVRVGEAIALIGQPDEMVDDIPAALAALGVAAAPTDAPAHAETATAAPAPAPTPARSPADGHRIFTSPLARRIARESDLPLDSIVGTGPNGRIVRRDIERAIAAKNTAAPAKPAAPAAPIEQQSAVAGATDVPHSRMRRLIAQRLSESKQTVPHFYLRGTARMDKLLRLRARLNASSTVKISVNDLIVKAVACAHQDVPAVNVIWTADAIRQLSGVDIAVAVATDTGLLTPVLRGVHAMPVSAVATATRDVVARAKQGRLQQSELEGGSCTVTNLGMYGTEEFAAIINPPQSSILAVGAAAPEPVVTKRGRLKVATVIHVTLSVDHRPVDGATAAEWMRAFIEIVEHPLRIIA